MPRLPHRSKNAIWPLDSVIARVFQGRNRRKNRKLRLSKMASGQRNSRLQSRLRADKRRNHVFFSLLQRRRNKPSRLNQRLSTQNSGQWPWKGAVVATMSGLVVGGAIWTHLFMTEQVTFAGVPYRIISKFWQDEAARTAYFVGDSEELHARLQVLGVEEDIKSFYRDRFSDEYELDRYIHQIMFDRTGYVGEAYQVDDYGQLISIEY